MLTKINSGDIMRKLLTKTAGIFKKNNFFQKSVDKQNN